MKKSGNKHQRDKYKPIKHQVQKQLRQAYWEYIEDILTPCNDNTSNSFKNMKKFWSFNKSKKTDFNGISSLKQDCKLITDTKQKATAPNLKFNQCFLGRVQ